MGRPSLGWRLRKHGGIYYARFTVAGRRSEPSTGEQDVERAAKVAARLYAEAVRQGNPKRRAPGSALRTTVQQAAEQWLTEQAGTLGARTVASYATTLERHIVPFFRDVSDLTEKRFAEYQAHRLARVKRTTIPKELAVLRGLVGWLYGENAPVVPPLPQRARGRPSKPHTRRGPVDLSPDEVERLLRALPARGYADRPCRAWFVMLYETSLRPATVAALSVPEHYRPGEAYLRLSPDIDKTRRGRVVPITEAAQAALDQVCPAEGLIFGGHSYRQQLRVSAAKVLPPDKAWAITTYDFRRARLTHWCETTTNLAGVQELAGHAKLSTTARYVRSSLRAAEAVLGESRALPRNSDKKLRAKRRVT